MPKKEASLIEIMDFLSYGEGKKKFADEWKELDGEERAFYREAVAEAIDK